MPRRQVHVAGPVVCIATRLTTGGYNRVVLVQVRRLVFDGEWFPIGNIDRPPLVAPKVP